MLRMKADKAKEKGKMQKSDYTGKTVEEALRRASYDLGVPPEDLEYEVTKDTTHNILGLVQTGEVTIRVLEPVVEVKTKERKEAEPEEVGEAEAVEEAGETPDTVEREAAEIEAEEEVEVEAEDEEEAPAPDLERNPPELEDITCEVLTNLIDKMGLLAAVEVVNHGGEIDSETGEISPLIVNVVGDELGILIGRRGETLRDLQFMVRLIVNRKIKTWPNLVVDVDGYKARREESLRDLAERMGDQVRETGRVATLEPMPAYERRIIHITLRDDPDVYTESTGEGEDRKVQIFPK
ncbi:MAG: RNA-binding cell elongation regulator Jag/EloR [Anaerolineae bacterium]